jgi:hypothetical protein
MAQLSFTVEKPAIVASQGQNVVLFDTRRRRSHARGVADALPVLSEAMVVRLIPANGGNRHPAFHSQERAIERRAQASNSNETGFTPFDFVATAFLILSVFAAPALVWTLLRTASLG